MQDNAENTRTPLEFLAYPNPLVLALKGFFHLACPCKAAWQVETDDWAQWNGNRATPYAINTVAEMNVERHEGTPLRGLFLVTAVRKSLTADETTRASLTLIAQGLINPGG